MRDLPDTVTCKKEGSTIIQRISESREQRHELALDEMKQEILLVSAVRISRKSVSLIQYQLVTLTNS